MCRGLLHSPPPQHRYAGRAKCKGIVRSLVVRGDIQGMDKRRGVQAWRGTCEQRSCRGPHLFMERSLRSSPCRLQMRRDWSNLRGREGQASWGWGHREGRQRSCLSLRGSFLSELPRASPSLPALLGPSHSLTARLGDATVVPCAGGALETGLPKAASVTPCSTASPSPFAAEAQNCFRVHDTLCSKTGCPSCVTHRPRGLTPLCPAWTLPPCPPGVE